MSNFYSILTIISIFLMLLAAWYCDTITVAVAGLAAVFWVVLASFRR